jgi:hypothetical protein
VKATRFIILFIALFPIALNAQLEHTLYGFKTVPQLVKLNPAMMPLSKVNVTLFPALSSVAFGANTSGLTVNQLAAEDISVFEDALSKMKDRNFLTVKNEIELLHLGLKLGDNYVSGSVTSHTRFGLAYPGDLARLIWEGNGKSFLGDRANMDNLTINTGSYLEYGVGIARTVGKSLNIGARVKYLSGLFNVHTRESQLGLYTDSLSFDLVLDGAFDLRTSGLPNLNDTAEFSLNPQELLFSNNNGLGLDVGISYEGKGGFNVSGSIINIGRITWKNNVNTYQNPDISFEFSGVPINDILGGGNDSSSTSSFQVLQDSLSSIFSVGQSKNPYSTSLPTQGFLSFSQSLFDRVEVGVLGTAIIQDKAIRMGVRANGSIFIGKWLGFTMNYGIYGGSWVNVGAGLSLAAGPVQFYVLSDNVLGFIQPFDSKNAHARFGFNLTIGKNYSKARLKVKA